MENFINIDKKLIQISKEIDDKVKPVFEKIENIQQYNEAKVLSAFMECGVSETHFKGSTGYGYGDRGREVLDKVFAKIVGAEDALVRHNFVCGTHALSVALFGVLRTGDTMVSLTGRPYDTMEEVIGIRGKGNGSLKDFGVNYKQLDLLEDGKVDFDNIKDVVKGCKVVYIQRSRGYSLRESLTVETIQKMIDTVKKVNKDAFVIIDNCYGEFVQKHEPTQVGADLIVGSLIKNPGGGIAETGGYIAGRKDLIELCAYRLTAVGIGKEAGCTLNQSKGMFMGLFFAPSVVASALKTSVFALCMFEKLGYKVYPKYDDTRTDIISAIELGTPQGLVAFCQGIQKGSPVDSFVTPEAWDMPGYENPVVMASGAFNMGSSIELSADGPIRPPYAVWLQGGLTYNTGKIGILLSAQAMYEKGLFTL